MVTLVSAVIFTICYLISVSGYVHFAIPKFSDRPASTKWQKFVGALQMLPLVPTGLLPAIAVWLYLRSRRWDRTRGSQSDFEMSNFFMALGVFFWPVIILAPFMPSTAA